MFWKRFYELCKKKGTKPNPVAEKVGISSATITKWKNGSSPNSEAIIKIADYFDVSVDYLLGRTDYPEINKGQFEYNGVKQEGVIEETTEGYIFRGEKK